MINIKAIIFGISCIVLLASCDDLKNIADKKEEESDAVNCTILSDKADTYLPDFSYAGYHWGEEGFPVPEKTLNVRGFGAIPDDTLDDTEAFKKALSSPREKGYKVISIPKGKYIISDILYIEQDSTVLRGENGTVLYFPQPLTDLPVPEDLKELDEYLTRFNKIEVDLGRGINERYSLYAWSGGYIWSRKPGMRHKDYLPEYDQPVTYLTNVDGRSDRGAHYLQLDNTKDIKPGDLLRIHWFAQPKDSSLVKHIYQAEDVKGFGKMHWHRPDRSLITQEVTVTAVGGKAVSIKEPLLHDLRPEWQVEVSKWEPLREIGIESIVLEFPVHPYRGHHVEDGYSGIFLTNTAHAWVKDVMIKNGDNGVLLEKCKNVTVEGVEVFGDMYHYAVEFGNVCNVLARNITIDAHVLHSLSCNTKCKSSVFTDCTIKQHPTFDQHRGVNHQNLFDHIVVHVDSDSVNIFGHGGAGYWRPTHGAFNTFWNIQLLPVVSLQTDKIYAGKLEEAYGVNLVNVHSAGGEAVYFDYKPDPYLLNDSVLLREVPSLHQHQLEERLKTK